MNQSKLTRLKQWMAQAQVDCVYISDPQHIAYLSGYASNPHERILALLIPLAHDPWLFTPALEIEDAKQSPWPYAVYGYTDQEAPFQKIGNQLQKNGVPQRMAVEKDALVLAHAEQLKMYLPTTDFSTNVSDILSQLQLIKTDAEIQRLQKAGEWADIALDIGFRALQLGATETEVVAEIEYQLKKQGIRHMSFDTLVLFGSHAASPHGKPGNRALQENELALFDLGVISQQYCSDVTRTVAYKEPTAFQKEIYDLVLQAQTAAMQAVKPGITAGEIDEIARTVISEAGYGAYFTHRLGHGIGTSVHEFPSLVTGNPLVLEKNMCFSIEPGIYIPDQVGVRIEDCVYVTEDGCQPFTTTTKELQVFS